MRLRRHEDDDDVPVHEMPIEQQNRVLLFGINASVRALKWLFAVMFVITIGSVIRAETIQDSADKSVAASRASRIASENAQRDLKEAIEASNGSPDPQVQRVFVAVLHTECMLARSLNEPLPEGCVP